MAEPQATPSDDRTPGPDDDAGPAKHVAGDAVPVESPGSEFVTGADGQQPAAETDDLAGPPTARSTTAVQAGSVVSADDRTEQPDSPEATARVATVPPVTAPEQQPRVATTEPIAAATERPVPRKRSNRLFATGMVLLSALLFEVLYLALLALLVNVLSGPSQVLPALQSLVTERLVWVPLVIFVVLYELLVLLFNRAGRFVYVVASLVVGMAVYLGSIFIAVPLVTGQSISREILNQVLISPEFVLTGIAAREVMLWTGFAIGAHGKRLRRKNREARDEYEHELADA